VTFANTAACRTLETVGSEIRSSISAFDPSAPIGQNVDALLQGAGLDANAGTTQSGTAQFGRRTLYFVISPVLSENGDRLGGVVEMTDKTEELEIQSEVQSAVEHAMQGDLSHRIDAEGKTGYFAQLAKAVNELLHVNQSVVDDALRVFSALSRGDLTQSITRNYEGDFKRLKQDANSTIETLTDVAAKIQGSAESVRTGAGEISRGNLDLSQRTEKQATSLDRTSASMQEMTSSVQDNADNAQNANQLAKEASQQAALGGSVVANAVAAMTEINESSRRISDIIGVIDEIACQTNLLALNASVEAARAGEQGRGFAVVASEVRNLAGRSATAAKEIKDLILDSTGKVAEGSRLVNESGETLEGIVQRVDEVASIIGKIAGASQQQADGIVQVSDAITQLEELTQQNAALVEEAASASESLRSQADSMTEVAGFFNVANSTDGNARAAANDSALTSSKVPPVSAPRAVNDDLDWQTF